VRSAHESIRPRDDKPRELGLYIHKPPADYLRLVAECCDRCPPRPGYAPLK
jgi:hypothetical protein